MPELIYGMAKLSKPTYGYGSQSKNFDQNKFLTFLSKNFLRFECSDRYTNSVHNISKLNNKIVHYKIDKVPINYNEIDLEEFFKKKINKAHKKLNTNRIEILYLHENSIKITGNKIVLKILKKLKKKNYFKSLGAIIYTENELKYVLKSKIFNCIQIPVNLADSYLYFKYMNKFNKKIIIGRSIFLQGTLINVERRNIHYNQINSYNNKILFICKKYKIDLNELIIRYVLSLKRLNYIILGSLNKKNIINDNKIKKTEKLNNSIMKEITKISNTKKKWTNPQKW